MQTKEIGDPGPAVLLVFGIALVMLGFTQIVSTDAAGGLTYALLIAGLAEAIGGGLALLRGDTYFGCIVGCFGLWVIGFYLLSGNADAATGDALGYYTLTLVGPLVLLAVPAFKLNARVLAFAFVALTLMILALALGYLLESSAWAKTGGVLGFISGLTVWFMAYERMAEITGTARAAGVPAPSTPAADVAVARA